MIINKFQIKLLKITMFINLFYSISCTVKQHNKDEKPKDYYVEQNYKSLEQKNIENEIEKYNQVIFSDLIKSVQIGTKSISTGEPCYSLGSNDNISIDFDILNGNIESLQYEIIHCNKNWEKSNLMEMEYIEGFAINFIENNEISHGPIQQYIHYNFEVPNENLNFIKSGNYIIKVFYENDIQNPLMTLKLFVSEQVSTIDFNLLKSNNMEQRKYIQNYEVNCTYNPQNINDPYTNIFINIQQNHQEFDEHWLSGPNFIRENKLVFLTDEDLFFDGSNEFRFFEMSTFRHGSQNIKKIFLDENVYKIVLEKDTRRSYKQYLEYKDLDGRYFTRTYDNDNVNSQGEYGVVNFELPIRYKINEGIYIFGELSNWSINESFKMKYDTISKSYKNSIILKQGYYNYLYVTKDHEKISTRQLEGAHFETNNEYIIKVYYRDPLELYDRLLGYQVFKINS
tara:strand:+ start:6175 stop:7536 length:1362 start_codon:yes stop_codon:yes gene_type:complete